MELPKKYLESLKDHIIKGNAVEFYQYDGYKGAKRLAKDLGETLELLESNEAQYIIGHSYNALFKNVYDKDVLLSQKEWKFLIKCQAESLSKERKNHINNKRNNFERER